MRGKERILAALDRKQPDKVPIFEGWINESSIVNLAKLLSIDTSGLQAEKDTFGEERVKILDAYSLIVQKLDLDAICYIFSMGLKNIGENRGQDKYGTVYRLSEHGEPFPIDGPIKDLSDLKGFDMISGLKSGDFSRFKYIAQKVGDEKAHFIHITDPFKVSWRLRGGMQNLLMDYLLQPKLAHELGKLSTDFDMAAIGMAIEAGADVIFMSGDLAGEDTTIMSPEHYREYIKPYHERIVEYVHQKGARIVKHSDGNIWPILDDLIEAGFDGVHPIQPQCMDIGEVKRYVAGRICILGNIDCRNLLVFGSESEVRESVKETIEKAAPGGGYIISSSNSIHPGCKAENYIAMVEAAREYGVY